MISRRLRSRLQGAVVSLCVCLPLSCVGTSASAESFSPWGDEGLRGYLQNFVEVPLDVFRGVHARTIAGEPSTLLAWGAIGGSFLLDEAVRDAWQENLTSEPGDQISSLLDSSGRSTYLLAGLGLSLGTSFLLQDEALARTSALALQSFAVAQGGAAFAKYTAGRLRPHESGGDSDQWREGSTSFFSAHSSGAWSVATVIAYRHSDSNWVPALAYGWATSVSLSRINDDMHFLSDVVVGGLWGYLVGRSVVGLDPVDEKSLSVTPMIQHDALGLTFSATF